MTGSQSFRNSQGPSTFQALTSLVPTLTVMPVDTSGWDSLEGAFLHGIIQEEDHKISGKDISYIYPDYDTMLHGKFEDKVMLSAREAALVDIGCDDHNTGLPIITSFKFNSTDAANEF